MTSADGLPFSIDCQNRLLVATFAEPQTVLSWSILRPGFQEARHVAWVEVRNADLPADLDPVALVRTRLASVRLSDAIPLVTSRDITRHHFAQSEVEGIAATCLATAGLSNGERVGQRFAPPSGPLGTINTLVHVSQPLSQAAMLEALSIVASARTAAVLDAGVLRDGVRITGTGTDCIVLAAPPGRDLTAFSGMHTAVGEAVGAATYRAMQDAISVWRRDMSAMAEAESLATSLG